MTPPHCWPEGRRLLLMRHGETYEPRLDTPMASGEEDPHLPLTPRGEERLAELARSMASLRIDAACSSTFQRSRQTARIVVGPRRLEVSALEALSELRLHPPPGGTLLDVARRYIALVRELQQKPAHEVSLDCGRSLAEVVEGALEAVCSGLEQTEGTLLVVAHGGLNRFLLAHWLGLPPSRALGLDQNFACVNVVEFLRGGRPWVRTLNWTLHDPLKTGSAEM